MQCLVVAGAMSRGCVCKICGGKSCSEKCDTVEKCKSCTAISRHCVCKICARFVEPNRAFARFAEPNSALQDLRGRIVRRWCLHYMIRSRVMVSNITASCERVNWSLQLQRWGMGYIGYIAWQMFTHVPATHVNLWNLVTALRRKYCSLHFAIPEGFQTDIVYIQTWQ